LHHMEFPFIYFEEIGVFKAGTKGPLNAAAWDNRTGLVSAFCWFLGEP